MEKVYDKYYQLADNILLRANRPQMDSFDIRYHITEPHIKVLDGLYLLKKKRLIKVDDNNSFLISITKHGIHFLKNGGFKEELKKEGWLSKRLSKGLALF